MSFHYLRLLQQSLSNPNETKEGLTSLAGDSQFYFQILRVKLQSADPALREEAVREIKELKSLLERYAR